MGRKTKAQRLAVVTSELTKIQLSMEQKITELTASNFDEIDPDELNGGQKILHDNYVKTFCNEFNNIIGMARTNFESDLDDLKTEMENWRDNMPENLHGGDKYERIDEVANALDDAKTALESLEDISNPSDAQNVLNELCDAISTLEAIDFPPAFGS